MYRKETLLTAGEEYLVLVCEGNKHTGIGIENFRIFSKTDLAVDIGYTPIAVRTDLIDNVWNESRGRFLRIYQPAYYVLDLKQERLFRVNVVNPGARFPARFAKKALILATYMDAEYFIEEDRGYLHIGATEDAFSSLRGSISMMDKEHMPGAIAILDFKTRKVQKVQQAIFLN